MGSIRARSDSGQLFLDFRCRGIRCRELTLLDDTKDNRVRLAKVLARIEREMAEGTFDYRRHFPNSTLAAKFDGKPASSAGVGAADANGATGGRIAIARPCIANRITTVAIEHSNASCADRHRVERASPEDLTTAARFADQSLPAD